MLLRQGDRGEQVRELQLFLNAQGEKLDADGRFGPLTTAAVMRFQNNHGLTTDGIFGPKSYLIAAQYGFVGGGLSAAPKKKTILVSAGHANKAGQDRGVAGNGYIEGVEAVKLRDALAAKLRLRGFTVREDGEDGVNEPLAKALALIAGTDLAIELHFNGGPPTATGVEVLSKPDKKAVAQKIAKAIGSSLSLKLRGDNGWKADNSGQHHRLAFCERGGLIVEVCFMSNELDMAVYSGNFTELVNALAAAIAE